MGLIEYIEQYVNNNFDSEVEKYSDQIINYLMTHEIVNIELKPFSTDEIIKIGKTEPLEVGPLVTVNNNGIVIKATSEKIEKLIINNLSKNIKSLKAPNKVIDSLNLEEYKNLTEITFSEKREIDREYLDKLSNTSNIKKINGLISYTSDKKDEIIFSTGMDKKIILYKDLVVRHSGFKIYGLVKVEDNSPYKDIDKILKTINDETTEEIKTIYIHTEEVDSYLDNTISYSSNNKIRLRMKNFASISEVRKAIESFENNGYKIELVEVELQNKDYEDIHLLKEIEEKYDTEMKYEGATTTVTVEEFIAMRATLDYYKSVIEGNNLSPFEKLVYAYDIIKSFEYEHSKDPSDSRNIHSIIRDGKIVCVGYSVFLKQLLNEEGIDCILLNATIKDQEEEEYHKRNMVYIKDEKYGIDGSFVLDATWDSSKNLVKVINDNGDERIGPSSQVKDTYIVEKYLDNLSIYDHFMIPESDFGKVFAGEKEIKIDKRSSDKDECEKVVSKFKGGERPSLETILRAVSVVRLKQGYSKDQAIESIKDTIELIEYQRRREQEKAGIAVKK